MFVRIRNFFIFDLWNFSLKKVEGRRHFFYKTMRVIYLAGRGFFQNRCALRASALTYYTLMSLVPAIAMSLAIAKGFGFEERLEYELVEHFKDQRVILDKLLRFSHNLLIKAQGGVIAAIGVLVLSWSVIKVLSHIESALNTIWGIKKSRTLRRKFGDYFAMMFLGPVIFVVSSSVTVFIVSHLRTYVENLPLHETFSSSLIFLIRPAPYCLLWILFTAIYLFMPNTKVRLKSAFLGGIIGGSLYQIIQITYLSLQFVITRFSAIYGSFAALPLFLVWVQLSWFILFLGAEVSFAFQEEEKFEFESNCLNASYRFKLSLALWMMHQSIRVFLQKKGPLIKEDFRMNMEIPHTLMEQVIEDLIQSGLLIEIQKKNKFYYQPAVSVDSLRIQDVVEALERSGSEDFSIINSEVLNEICKSLKSFHETIRQTEANRLLRDIQ